MRKTTGVLIMVFSVFVSCATTKRYTRLDNDLLTAVKCGHYDVAGNLIKKGADITVEDRYGRNVVFYALRNGDIEYAEWSMKNGAPLKKYLKRGDRKYHVLLGMAEGSRPGKDGKSAGLDYLLKREGDPGKLVNRSYTRAGGSEFTLVMQAAWWNSQGALNTLLQYKPDLTITGSLGENALDVAYFRKNLEAAEILIRHGAVMTKNWTLINAIVYKNPKIAEEALKDGADPNARVNRNSVTPLVLSITNRTRKITQLLLDHGASPHRVTACYQGPIHFAVFQHDLSTIKLLVEKGVNVNEEDMSGLHAVYYAHLKGFTDIVSYLESAGSMTAAQAKKLYDQRAQKRYERKQFQEKLLKVLDVTARGMHGFNKGYYESKGYKYTLPR